ncbi:MAG: hypothetical protein JWN78_2222 [Bacteroidota bacterium]|nr:hypothetical protein [Bacteroidota bacterium]
MDFEPLKIEFKNFNKDEFVKIQLIKFKLVQKTSIKYATKVSVVAFSLLAIALLVYSSDHKFNPLFLLGTVAVLFSVILISGIIKTRKKYHNEILQLANKYQEINMDCCYEISNDSIKYTDKEKVMDFKWSVFKFFALHQEYLIIALNHNLASAYFFSKKDLDDTTFNRLIEIVKTKLQEDKIR